MRQIIFIIIIGLFFSLGTNAQITSDAGSIATEYADSNLIFGFCTDDANGGELIASDSTKKGGYEYQWYKFNSTSNVFDPISTGLLNADSTQSVLSNLSNGGYKVVLSNGPKPQEYVAWVFINDELIIDLELYDKNDCNIAGVLALPYYPSNAAFSTSFTYKDPSSLTEYTLTNKIKKFVWSSNTEPSITSFNSASLFVTNLPWENTVYTVSATDNFGCTITDDIDYIAIATKADFRWASIDDKTSTEIGNGDTESDLSGSAPLTVQFFNESKNGETYRWSFFKDSTRTEKEDSLYTSDLNIEPLHTYYYTNTNKEGRKYLMELYSKSSYGCEDSVSFAVRVLPTKLDFPNVFTPNGDDYNNVFILTDYQSIRNFKITIFNRVGQIVHEYDGDVRDWEGWKGYVKNTNNEAPEGNYFFVVNVKGWDKNTYDNDNIGKLSEDSSTEGSSSKTVEFGVVRLFRN